MRDPYITQTSASRATQGLLADLAFLKASGASSCKYRSLLVASVEAVLVVVHVTLAMKLSLLLLLHFYWLLLLLLGASEGFCSY